MGCSSVPRGGTGVAVFLLTRVLSSSVDQSVPFLPTLGGNNRRANWRACRPASFAFLCLGVSSNPNFASLMVLFERIPRRIPLCSRHLYTHTALGLFSPSPWLSFMRCFSRRLTAASFRSMEPNLPKPAAAAAAAPPAAPQRASSFEVALAVVQPRPEPLQR